MDLEIFRKSRRNEIQRAGNLRAAAADVTMLPGRFMVNSSGETTKTIIFPVKYAELPVITFGFELPDTVNTIKGQLPAVTAHVSDWRVEEKPPVSRLYTGAEITVVSSGPTFSKFVVTWVASGVAFTNPV